MHRIAPLLVVGAVVMTGIVLGTGIALGRVVPAGKDEVRIEREVWGWRVVSLATQPLKDGKLAPALHAQPVGLTGFLAAGPLTQRVLAARSALRAAFAPKADELARVGFDIKALATTPGDKADAASVIAVADARSWAAIEATAAAWFATSPHGPAGPFSAAPSYAAHRKELAFASLGLPAPGPVTPEAMGMVGDLPPTTTRIDPVPVAEPLAGFALTHALGIRRLRAMMAKVDKSYVQASDGTLTEIEELLVAAAEADGLPEGLTWATLGYDDAFRAKARERLAHGDVEDYRRVYKGEGGTCAAMLGFATRPIEVSFAGAPKYSVTGKGKPQLAWGLTIRYAPAPVFDKIDCASPAAINDETLRAAIGKAATIDDAKRAVQGARL